jgi:hypothetical protein
MPDVAYAPRGGQSCGSRLDVRTKIRSASARHKTVPSLRLKIFSSGVTKMAEGQLTGSADTASAASMTAWPGTIFRSARLVCDPLPVPKLVAPAVKVNASPLVLA